MKKKKSVKKKLFQIIMISTIACVLASCLVSFMAVHSIEKKQIQSSMRFSLHQIMSNFEQGYLNLVNIMQSLLKGSATSTKNHPTFFVFIIDFLYIQICE